MKKPFYCAFCILMLYFFVAACVDIKKATYFNNLPDSLKVSLNQIQPPQQKIQVNDLLEIKVGGENEKATAYINQYLGGGSAGTGAGIQSTVDVDGNIDLPVINKIKVVGLTRDQAKDTIAAYYGTYLKNPIVSVRFINFRFTVLGEVRAPGYLNSTTEKLNLFEAIALAGDMTPYSRRDNVKLIRETDGKREVISLNFNDKSILNSPYFYINRSDIIYVEAGKNRYSSENFGKTSTIIATVLGLTALIFSIFRK